MNGSRRDSVASDDDSDNVTYNVLNDVAESTPLYQHSNTSHVSHVSVFQDVEMAHDEPYDGPIAESMPSSVSAFLHRRPFGAPRASFTYYDHGDGSHVAEDLIVDEDGNPVAIAPESPFEDDEDVNEDSVHGVMNDADFWEGGEEALAARKKQIRRRRASSAYSGLSIENYSPSTDPEQFYHLRRRSSASSGGNRSSYSDHPTSSVRDRLLSTSRRDSITSTTSSVRHRFGGRHNQKIHMVNEDLTIVLAGFYTSSFRWYLYLALCILTGGVAYLFLRWFPRYYIAIVGHACALHRADWVVVENQWGEISMVMVERKPYGRPLSSIFNPPSKDMLLEYDEVFDPILHEISLLNYRYVRFFFHPRKDKFMLFSGWKDPHWSQLPSARRGITSEEASLRETALGTNLIDIEAKPVSQLLVDEVLHPFYVFQVASLTLWAIDEYYYYAVCIFIISLGGIAIALVETRTTMARLRELSRFECEVRVLRNGFWRYVASGELVPGDVYEVSDPSLTQFPTDSVLLSGECIVNESMLTGESVPVSKTPATSETFRDLDLTAPSIAPHLAKHFLYSGTKIIRARRPAQVDADGNGAALGLVVRTGFHTTKGSLVRSMMFPKPVGFKFYRDSFRYIGAMTGVAFIGFLYSIYNFLGMDMTWSEIIIRSLDLITIVVPPALPATLTIGTSFAISRLKKKLIFCISPQRVNVGGKIDIMCFDKTGTLTEDGLDVLGVRPVSSRQVGPSRRFHELIPHVQWLMPYDRDEEYETSVRRAMLFTMATCHSLRCVDNKLMGDPLDMRMFEFTGWSFEEGHVEDVGGGHDHGSGSASFSANDGSTDFHDLGGIETGGLSPSCARPPSSWKYSATATAPLELGILKSFEFVAELRRASVMVRQFGRPSVHIYVKGAPESLRDICRPESLPADFDEQLEYYTHRGYRVIACATRVVARLTWVKAQKMRRSDVESKLDFLGFLVFENKLKSSTVPVLRELRASNIDGVMVTGDNILTAVSVARECGLVDRTAPCFIGRLQWEGTTSSSSSAPSHVPQADGAPPPPPHLGILWESMDHPSLRLDPQSLLPAQPFPTDLDVSIPLEMSQLKRYSIAVTGDVFRYIVDHAPMTVLQRLLVRGRVYARMSPDEKHELVAKLQGLDYTCGFCGDGANDCGALKAADVGISLSEAEASVAAPFTSQVFDIQCVPQVISEGRAALVTSFNCFKYMSLYSAIQFATVTMLYTSGTNLGNFQYLFIDLFLILPLAMFMGWTGPAATLHRKRPTADLVSRKVLVPLLSQMAWCVVVQLVVAVVVRRQAWFIPPPPGNTAEDVRGSENTSLFLASCFQYILMAVALNVGPPFREPVRRNWPFLVVVAVALALTLYMVAGLPGASTYFRERIVEITLMHRDFQAFLVVWGGIVYGLVAIVGEQVVYPRLAQRLGKLSVWGGGGKKRKQYKVVLEQLRL